MMQAFYRYKIESCILFIVVYHVIFARTILNQQCRYFLEVNTYMFHLLLFNKFIHLFIVIVDYSYHIRVGITHFVK